MAVIVYEPRRFFDDRGWFSETFNARSFRKLIDEVTFVQDNQSFSREIGTLRGLHFQIPPFAQSKLVRCLTGAILDIVVDIRSGSPTYGKWLSCEISAENGRQLFIPAGFAHGLVTLEPDTHIAYKVSDFYAPEGDKGFRWDDPDLGIEWPLPPDGPLLSPKDQLLPLFKDFESPFLYDGVPMALTIPSEA
jgi:dTDP-4-dehydrorhamnose 3,5-epimerase